MVRMKSIIFANVDGLLGDQFTMAGSVVIFRVGYAAFFRWYVDTSLLSRVGVMSKAPWLTCAPVGFYQGGPCIPADSHSMNPGVFNTHVLQAVHTKLTIQQDGAFATQ